LSQRELGGFDVGDHRFAVFVVVGRRPASGVHGQDLLVELGGLLRQVVRVAVGALLGQLEGDLDVVGILGITVRQGEIGVGPGQGFLDLLQERVGRRSVADDPIDLFAVLVDEELGRRRPDVEPVEGRVAVLRVADGPVEDDARVEEIGVFGVVVELLNQQFAASSATREEIDEDELVLFLGFGQRLVERPGEDRRRLGGGERGDEEKAGESGELLHEGLLFEERFSVSIHHPAAQGNPPGSSLNTLGPERRLHAGPGCRGAGGISRGRP